MKYTYSSFVLMYAIWIVPHWVIALTLWCVCELVRGSPSLIKLVCLNRIHVCNYLKFRLKALSPEMDLLGLEQDYSNNRHGSPCAFREKNIYWKNSIYNIHKKKKYWNLLLFLGFERIMVEKIWVKKSNKENRWQIERRKEKKWNYHYLLYCASRMY